MIRVGGTTPPVGAPLVGALRPLPLWGRLREGARRQARGARRAPLPLGPDYTKVSDEEKR